jgi:UDP-glucose-4-epimerase GalE
MALSQNVLVTGGAGYVGSHTCKALHLSGYTPVTLDNLSRGHESAVKWGPLITADIHDHNALENAFASYRPVAVLHFAAFAYVGESMSNPALYFRNNAFNTLPLLEAMRRHDVTNIVFSSTCATYGIPERVPIREKDPQQPVNPYGESKLMVERMLRHFGDAHGTRFVALRYFNAAGSDPDGEIGWKHEPETRLIPRALKAARAELPPLEIFGDDFPTPDGTCIRDYVHVSDLADAHVLALRYLLDGNPSVALNLGTGVGFSIYQVLQAIERRLGRAVPAHVVARRIGDPPVLIADPFGANNILGFSPKHSSLDQIVATAWNWLEQESERVAINSRGPRDFASRSPC